MTDAEAFDLYRWPEGKPRNVIDAMPALIRKAAFETMYQVPRPKGHDNVTDIRRKA